MRGRGLGIVLVVCAALLGAAPPASALVTQDPVLPSRAVDAGDIQFAMPDVVTWEHRLREVQQWIADFQKWREWNALWRNRREPGWIGARERKIKPDPPDWLAAECHDAIVQEGETLAEACRLLTEWKDDDGTALLRKQTTSARTQREEVHKTVWWEHVHFDALWPMMQLHGSVFGVVGMHATIEVAGRLQIFVAPGAILLNLPKGRSEREWRPATDWGIAWRMFDFTMPGTDRRANLHLNLAKAWLIGGPGNLTTSSIDLAGFSVTFAKKR
jgi:hypothetical protein